MRSVIWMGAVAAFALVAGCTVHGRTAVVTEEPYGTTYITSAPVDDYAVYPQAYYGGRTVYYVRDHWGYPHQGRWVYYRNEPPPLVRYRSTVRSAPPAYHQHYDHYERGGPPPSRPPPASAPPARRTR